MFEMGFIVHVICNYDSDMNPLLSGLGHEIMLYCTL